MGSPARIHGWVRMGVAATLLCFLLVAIPVGATVLTFSDFSVFGTLPSAYGNKVADPTVADPNGFHYGSGGGATPNVGVSYGSVLWTWPGWNLSDLTDGVLWGWTEAVNPSTGTVNIVVKFTADPGYQVTLNSFDLAGYNGSLNQCCGINVFVSDSTNNRVLFSDTDANILNPHTSFLPNVSAQSLTLLIDAGKAGTALGLDNIRFSQQEGAAPVPEPATLLLLGSGLVGLGFGRRRFSKR